VGTVILIAETLRAPAHFAATAGLSERTNTPECSGATVGACCLSSPGTGILTPLTNAGAISIAEGAMTLATMSAQPDYAASSQETPTLKWEPGDTLEVTSTGGTVAPFTLAAAAPVALAGLDPSFDTTLAVKTSQELEVKWIPNGDACTQVRLTLTQEQATMPIISCIAYDSAGNIHVPSSLLDKFTAAAGEISIGRTNAADVTVANAAVGLIVTNTIYATTTYSR
jgi:hypothetical protein